MNKCTHVESAIGEDISHRWQMMGKHGMDETNLEIGEQMGVSYPAVSKLVERMQKEMKENRNMRKGTNRMEGNLSQVNRLTLWPFFNNSLTLLTIIRYLYQVAIGIAKIHRGHWAP
ncbi:MAG TPA: hypothetical protein ENH30_04420 [Nitrospirae bacterium]|nr:hypothetical protein [Nitrospirota bacterium]